jgi:tetratricopeptide (TPR) repeat protein
LDHRPTWGGGKLNATSVLLEQLGDAEVSRLLANLLGEAKPSEAVEQMIIAAAEGNPLFVEEYLAMLLEDGIIRRAGDEWVPTTNLARISPPTSIIALLTARLDRLQADEREVLEPASVIGHVFSREAVEALVARATVPEVAHRLDSLVRREIIRPDRRASEGVDAYRFKHLLIRDAAYAGLPKNERVSLHERLADWLGRAAPGKLQVPDEVIGAHLEQAYRYRSELGPLDDRAVEVGRSAAARLSSVGRGALAQGQVSIAGELLRRAAALIPDDDRDRLELLLDQASALIAGAEFPAARQVSDEVMERAHGAGFDDLGWHAALQQIEVESETTDSATAQAREMVWAAIDFFEAVGDDRALAHAWFLDGNMQFGAGQLALSRRSQERAVEHASRAGDIRRTGQALSQIAYIDMMGPATVAVGLRTAEQLLNWAHRAGSLFIEAVGLAYLGRLKAMAGEVEASRRLLSSAISISDELGRYHEVDDIPRWIGLVEWLAGDLVAAERGLRQGYDGFVGLGLPGRAALITAELARMLYLQDRLDEAAHLTQVAEASTSTACEAGIGWRGVRGRILARRGEDSEGLAFAREAVAIAEGTDLLVFRARALEDLAEVLELIGRPDDARPCVAKAIAFYEQKGITVLADRARHRTRVPKP